MIIPKGLPIGFVGFEMAKLLSALSVANQVLRHPEFASRVLSHKKLDDSLGFESTRSSNADVLSSITLDGDTFMTFEIRSYSWWNFGKRKEVAHEGPEGPVFNRRFFSGQSIPSLVNTITHEFCHRLGFDHDYYATAERQGSVPYGVGSIAEAVAEMILAPQPPPPAPKVKVESLV